LISDSRLDTLESMGKRRFLKTLAGFGVSATTLQYITKEALAEQTSDVKKEVPYVKALRNTEDGGRTPIYGTIARDKWLRINAAERASKLLARRLSKRFDSSGFEAGVTVDMSSGSPEWETVVSRITTETTVFTPEGTPKRKRTEPEFSLDQLKSELPNSMRVDMDRGKFSNDISVEVLARDEEKVDCGKYYDDTYRPVSGGCDINSGSTCSRAQEQDGNQDYVMVSCGHVTESINENQGGDVTQPGTADDGTKVGYTDSSMYWQSQKIDIGYFKPTSSVSVTDKIADENSDDYKSDPIAGIVTWDWIKSDGYLTGITKQGATIVSVRVRGCETPKPSPVGTALRR
jgi:hypothetical protein